MTIQLAAILSSTAYPSDMPLHTSSLPIDLLLDLLLRCSCSDLLRLQQCSHQWYSLLHSDRCVDYLLRQHCRLPPSQLFSLSESTTRACEFLYRLLPCLASAEVHLLAYRSLPPLHRALLAEAVQHSPLSVHELSLVHAQPSSLLPWLRLPNSPLLRLQLHEIVQLAQHSKQVTLHSLQLSDVSLWLLPQAACWQQRWDDYWLAVVDNTSDDTRQQSEVDGADARSEYEERSEWVASALQRMADKLHIGRLLDPRVLWIGHIQQSSMQPPAVFGYYLGHLRPRQHVVPATLHHNTYSIDAAYSDTTEDECGRRRSDVHLDVSRLPVVVADLTASAEGLNGFWLHVYDSLAALLTSDTVAGREEDGAGVRSFIEQVHRAACGEGEESMDTAVAQAAFSDRRALYLTCFPGADRPRWTD